VIARQRVTPVSVICVCSCSSDYFESRLEPG
jgi:hypothetical protein